MIDVEGLTVAYGRSLALERVTLHISEGICGLFGPNGSGKTTLLRVLAGLLRPTDGSATFGGSAIDAQQEDFRRLVGYAGHETGLYRHLTVGENLELFARLYGAPPERVDEVLTALDLLDRKQVRALALSAGLKRRAAVARALLHDPQLLLLDEPYANLDEEAAGSVNVAITAWHRPGKCAVIATHGAKRLKPIVNASIVLRRGNVASHRAAPDRAVSPT